MMDYLEELLPEEDGEALALELGQQVVPRRMEEPGAGQEMPPPAPGEGAEVPVVQPMGRADADELWAPLEEKGRRPRGSRGPMFQKRPCRRRRWGRRWPLAGGRWGRRRCWRICPGPDRWRNMGQVPAGARCA